MSGIQNAAYDPSDNDDGSTLTKRRSNGVVVLEELSEPVEQRPPVSTGAPTTIYDKLNGAIERHRKLIKLAIQLALNVIVIVFFGFATNYYLEWEQDDCGMQWCDGYGMLVLLVGFLYLGLLYFQIVKPIFGDAFRERINEPFTRFLSDIFQVWYYRLAAAGLVLVGFAIFVYFETRDETVRLISLSGMAVLLLIGFLVSKHPTRINFRPVLVGLTLQFLLGIFCIRWEVGRSIFSCVGNKVAAFLNYSNAGASFVYGDMLVTDLGVFAFAVLSVIYFFSFFISVLYYLGAMQWVVLKLGWILQATVGTTVCESVIAAANIFLGMSESPLLIRPYLKNLTHSEVHSIMASGFATVSGTVLAAYISFGANPAHLITASVMAAPSALCFAKLIYPETEESKTRSDNIQMEKSGDSSLLDAASNGASDAIPLVMGIIANLVAFVAFIAFVNGLLAWFGNRVGWDDVSLETIFGAIFRPVAYVMGVPWDDSYYVGKVIGIKTIVNEFVAFQRLGEFIKEDAISPRSAAIATYAVCGFANPSSLGIMIGSLGAMAPTKRSLITSVALRAFITGTLVCFMTASIAGLLMDEEIFNNFGKAELDAAINATTLH